MRQAWSSLPASAGRASRDLASRARRASRGRAFLSPRPPVYSHSIRQRATELLLSPRERYGAFEADYAEVLHQQKRDAVRRRASLPLVKRMHLVELERESVCVRRSRPSSAVHRASVGQCLADRLDQLERSLRVPDGEPR
eukprot:2521430-Prymnesium_polylepis.2